MPTRWASSPSPSSLCHTSMSTSLTSPCYLPTEGSTHARSRKARTVFWTATGQYVDAAEEPVLQDWRPHNLSNVPIAQEEPAIPDTIDMEQDTEEEEAGFISMTMPDDEGESFDAFPPIPESISAKSPSFHVLRPPRRIHDAITSCIEQCKRRRSTRRHHLRPRQITSRVIDRAYGEDISFPFKGVRQTTICCISANCFNRA